VQFTVKEQNVKIMLAKRVATKRVADASQFKSSLSVRLVRFMIGSAIHGYSD
jgi:hypothetical protein